METNTLKRKKELSLFFILWMVALLGIYSCKDQPKPLTSRDNCITLPRYQLKAMLSSGWQDSNDPNYVPRLYFTPFPSSPIAVDVFPQDRNNVISYGKRKSFSIANVSPACNFGNGTVVNQYYNFSNWGYWDANARDLINFDFLRLTPNIYKDTITGSEYLQFRVETVVLDEEGNENSTARGFSWPCPPYCCPTHCPTDQ